MPRSKCFCEKEVLEKAVELFWRKGFHATSMQDLVDHLGINRASLYGTYGDKKALFISALKHYQKTNGAYVQRFFEEQPSVREGLRAFFAQAIEEAAKAETHSGCFMVNTVTEMLPGDPEFASLLQQNKVNFEEMFAGLLARGVAAGEFDKDLDTAATAAFLFTLNNGLQVVAKLDPSKDKLTEMVETALHVLD